MHINTRRYVQTVSFGSKRSTDSTVSRIPVQIILKMKKMKREKNDCAERSGDAAR